MGRHRAQAAALPAARRAVGQFDPSASGDGSTLTARAVSGLRWSSIGYAALLIANVVYTVTMSRLLDPVAFGLIALAQIVVLFVQFFVRMGLASALVQKPELSKEDVRAASTAGVAVGVAFYAGLWVLAPVISDLFRAPALTPVLRLLGVTFLFEGMSMVGLGLLRRQLRFRELSIITFATYVLGYVVVGISLALLGAGVWSLVVGALVSSSSQAVWQYALLRHPVRPVLRWKPYQYVCGYGMRLSGAHVLDYVGGSLDTFTVGRYANTAVVGQYSRGYYLAVQPLRVYLAQTLTNVLFPHLSRIQEDSVRLRRAYLSMLMLSGLVVFPVCAGMAVAAREFVRDRGAGDICGGARRILGRCRWIPITRGVGVRRRRGRRRAHSACRLLGAHAAPGQVHRRRPVDVVRPGRVRQRGCRVGRGRHSCPPSRRGADSARVRR
jgi:lipopolysaccharide exporter